jgi:hypothetical protein
VVRPGESNPAPGIRGARTTSAPALGFGARFDHVVAVEQAGDAGQQPQPDARIARGRDHDEEQVRALVAAGYRDSVVGAREDAVQIAGRGRERRLLAGDLLR